MPLALCLLLTACQPYRVRLRFFIVPHAGYHHDKMPRMWRQGRITP